MLRLSLLVIIGTLTAACATSTVKPVNVPTAKQFSPVILEKNAQLPKIALSDPTSKIEEGTVTSTFAYGKSCIRSGEKKWKVSSLSSTVKKKFLTVVSDELMKANYNVFGDINDPFYQVLKNKADYLLGASLIKVKRNSCLFGKTQTGEAYVSIEWSLLDVPAQKIVFKSVKEGWTNTTVEHVESTNNLGYNVFRESLRSLLADEAFSSIMRKR